MPPKKATSTAAKATKASDKTAYAKKAATTKTAASSKVTKSSKRGAVSSTVAKAPAPESKDQPSADESADEVEEEEPAPKKNTKKTTAAKKGADEVEEEAAPKKTAAKKKSAEKAEENAVSKKNTKKATTAKKSADEVEADTAPKKTIAAKKSAPTTKKAPTSKVPASKASMAKKAAAVASEGSDKENDGAAPARAKTNGTKRKRTETPQVDEEDEEEEERAVKKAKKDLPALVLAQSTGVTRKIKEAKAPKVPKAPRVAKKKINDAPTEVLQPFVFGEGSSGELGLGSVRVDGKKPIDVKRPRLNPNLKNVVQIACGGMHVVALTQDNKILTWGVNDQGALGRDTSWEGGLRDMDDEDDDSEDEDDTGINPKESGPAEVNTSNIEPGTKFVQVVASDSASFALTEEGQVYGWGTFRNNEGILGFTRGGPVTQKTPILLPDLTKISQLAAGSNHVLALDSSKKRVLAWGSGQQCQLARKLVERDALSSLKPQSIGNLHRGVVPTKLACGSYHCFVIDQEGKVWAWGLNNYAELGLEFDAGEDGGTVLKPTLVESLSQYKIASIAGGEHHSLACTEDGKLLTWGRIDGHQVGLPASAFSKDNAIFDEHEKPRILMQPTVVEGIPPIALVAAGTDHSIAVTRDGQAYSWGFSANYQTGQGTDDDIETPTLIDNTAVRGKKIVWAGAGGQYSIVAAPAEKGNQE